MIKNLVLELKIIKGIFWLGKYFVICVMCMILDLIVLYSVYIIGCSIGSG